MIPLNYITISWTLLSSLPNKQHQYKWLPPDQSAAPIRDNLLPTASLVPSNHRALLSDPV